MTVRIQTHIHRAHLPGAAAERGGPADLLWAQQRRPQGLHLHFGPGGHRLPQHASGGPALWTELRIYITCLVEGLLFSS